MAQTHIGYTGRRQPETDIMRRCANWIDKAGRRRTRLWMIDPGVVIEELRVRSTGEGK